MLIELRETDAAAAFEIDLEVELADGKEELTMKKAKKEFVLAVLLADAAKGYTLHARTRTHTVISKQKNSFSDRQKTEVQLIPLLTKPEGPNG